MYRDQDQLTRALGILFRLGLERTGWRRFFSRWYYSDEPLRNDAVNLVREYGFQELRPKNTRLIGNPSSKGGIDASMAADPVAKAIAALRPFAELAGAYDNDDRPGVPDADFADDWRPSRLISINVGDLRRARSALATLEAGSGWRPIETAPKDGTRILVWDGKDGGQQTASWADDFEADGSGAWTDWVPVTLYSGSYLTYSPSLWQPLPSPPSNPGETK